MADGSGSNPSPAKEQPSASPSRNDDETADRGIPILIVEDNAGDITLLRTALTRKRLGGALTIVREDDAALRFADTIDSQPDAVCPLLVILDLNLPKVGGREILKRFRESARLSAVPIVILTSSEDQRDKDAALSLGATRYLHKPLNLEEFMNIGAIVEALLSTRSDG
jgi:two-component system response regulator